MIKVYVTSAFCKDNAGGNKAGVVFDHPELTRAQKMEISRQLGYSETAFVTASEIADYKLEYFTPTEEVPLCGHATIATFATMHLEGMLKKHTLTIETKAGLQEISISDDGLVFMQQNNPRFFEMLAPESMQASMGSVEYNEKLPIQIVSTGLRDILFPVASTQALEALAPDFEQMSALSKEKDVVGVHAYALTEDDSEVDAICRNFAPLYGIDEESATGTSNCALAGYFFKYINKKEMYVFEQGYTLGAPSRIVVRLQYAQEEIQKVYVGGRGQLVEVLRY